MRINPNTFRDDDFPQAGGGGGHWLDDPVNFLLRQALESAANATEKIPAERERLQKLLGEAKTEIERAAREWQIWYLEKTLERAEAISRRRLEHFRRLKTQEDFDAENEKCALDKKYWFEYYAWGYDPRARAPISIVPFVLYPKQIDLVWTLDDWVFNRRTSGIVEKSRDEGATELFVRWSIHNWRYRSEGFSVLLSTRKDDEIDTKKKKGTLFERARFQIRLLPHWMLPKNFSRERDLLADKLIANPDNGNAIQGEAPVERMGSGDRVTCAGFDEFAFWRFGGYPQFSSMSQTTDSIIMFSSVGGRLNQYADIAFDGVTPKFVLDWRDNPFKDKRWYDSLPYGFISPKMSKTTIAQEVDRNYDAAQPGKVWQVREEYSFITVSEFLLPFQKAGLENCFLDDHGKFRIPDDWRVIETHDYGKSEGHDWGFLIGAQPRASYPLNDMHFVFLGLNLEPTGLSTAEAVKLWRGYEEDLGLRQGNNWLNKPFMRYNSHEQDELRKVLLQKYGERWVAWKTDYQTGIETIEDWLAIVDEFDRNPFRPNLYGRTQMVFVAPDGEYELAFNERLSQYFVTISETERGYMTLRKQLSAYHYPMAELGKAKKDMRPAKEFDDIVDCLRGYAVNWNRKPEALTNEEKQEGSLPSQFRLSQINAQKEELTEEEFGQALISRQAKLVIPKILGGKKKPSSGIGRFKR